ncbi:ICAM5 protein, partial [Alaudala cheleensis]|nr:ICAM5 protein [Alaudala cheleensis]
HCSPTFSSSLSHLFPTISPPFPHLFPTFSCSFPHLFPTISPFFPTFSSPSPLSLPAKPHLDSSSCPSQQNWTEGQLGILTCRARGRPEPQVSCSKAGEEDPGDSRHSLEVGIAVPAHRGHTGTYRCRATNEVGTAERDV